MTASEHESLFHLEPSAPTGSPPSDVWADGAAYERYVGRWSRRIASEFLAWLAIAPNSRWLDVGCGTGALSETILGLANPADIWGVDRSADYVAYAREQLSDARAHFAVVDIQALRQRNLAYDVVVSGLVLNFLPQPHDAIDQMVRVMRNGGTVAAYVWDYAEKMQFMRHFWNAAGALDPDAVALDEGLRFPLCQPQALDNLFRSAGLQSVEVRAIEITTDFADFDDYWSPFLGGQGPAPSYVMSLSEERRVALRERLRQSLPTALDGSIPLVARAWAVRGVC